MGGRSRAKGEGKGRGREACCLRRFGGSCEGAKGTLRTGTAEGQSLADHEERGEAGCDPLRAPDFWGWQPAPFLPAGLRLHGILNLRERVGLLEQGGERERPQESTRLVCRLPSSGSTMVAGGCTPFSSQWIKGAVTGLATNPHDAAGRNRVHKASYLRPNLLQRKVMCERRLPG